MADGMHDLTELATVLRRQAAASGGIHLDPNTLWGSTTARVPALIGTHLRRTGLRCTVAEQDIPKEPVNGVLEFTARTPGTGENTFLGLLSVPAHFRFTLVRGELNFILALTPHSGGGNDGDGGRRWSFDTCYPELAGDPALAEVPFTDPKLTFSTRAEDQPFSFSAVVPLDGAGHPLAAVRTLLGSGVPASVTLAGSLSPGPAFDFAVRLLDVPSLKIADIVTVGTPEFRLSTRLLSRPGIGPGTDVDSGCGTDPGTDPRMEPTAAGALPPAIGESEYGRSGLVSAPVEYPVVQWSVQAPVTLGNRSDLQLQAVWSGALQSFHLSVTPDEPRGVGLGDLTATLLGGAVGQRDLQGFFGGVEFAEKFLTAVLKALTLRGFDAQVSLRPKPQVRSAVLTVGSSNGAVLPLVPDVLTAHDVSLTWAVFAPAEAQRRQSLVALAARLTLGAGGRTYPFELSVGLPHFAVEGRYAGPPVALRLADLMKDLFGDTETTIPLDIGLLFTGMSLRASPTARSCTLSVTASGGAALFGTPLLSVHDAELEITRIPDPKHAKKSLTFFSFHGVVRLGPLALGFRTRLETGKATVLQVRMVEQTLGSLLGHLAGLVDPYLELRLEPPWDVLGAIGLDALTLEIDLSAGTVRVSHPLQLDLGFATLDGIALTYSRAKQEGKKRIPPSVKIKVSGSFLGDACGRGAGAKRSLEWNPVTERAPAVPGLGGKLFDLQYLGLGQRVRIDGADLTSIEKIFAEMSGSMVPLREGTAGPDELPKIVFDADSGWLIAARFTLLDTFSLTGVFNDPTLAGIRVSVAGEKARVFDGLAFEILYVRITPTLGLYHTELQLPEAMRQLEFGVVSVTLPTVTLDIYTNGNFRIDLGFPQGLDFSRSFSVQVFPFVGFGGLYFALLDGATSRRVPRVTNGRFTPVVEAGIGLNIGVGKTVKKGIFSAGATVTLVGVVEGVLGWFEPASSSVPKDLYYRVQGTVALVGEIFGRVEFGIVSAEVHLSAHAQVTFTVEAHEPAHIALQLHVTARASIKVVFVRVHFSFSLTLDLAFTVGTKSDAPWQLQPPELRTPATEPPPQGHPLSAQAALRPSFPALAAVHGSRERWLGLTAPRQHTAAAQAPLADVTGSVAHLLAGDAPVRQQLDLVLVPAFTRADAGTPAVACVPLTLLPNSIRPDAYGAEETRLVADGAADAPFNQFAVRLFLWVLRAALPELDDEESTVSWRDLRTLARKLREPDVQRTLLHYDRLRAFLAGNFVVRLAARTPGTERPAGGTVFPVLPELTLAVGGRTVDFAQHNRVTPAYQALIDDYLRQLTVDHENDVQRKASIMDDAGGAVTDRRYGKPPADRGERVDAQDTHHAPPAASMASLVFQNYCTLLARALTDAALTLLRTHRHPVPDPCPSLQQIADSFPHTLAEYRTAAGETLEELAARFAVSPQELSADNAAVVAATGGQGGALPPGSRLTVRVKVTPASIVAANLTGTGLLAATALPLSGIRYQVRTGDTALSIATALTAGRTMTPAAHALALGLLDTNATAPVLTPATRIALTTEQLPCLVTQADDTLALIAATYLVRVRGPETLNSLSGLRQLTEQVIVLNPKPDGTAYGADEPIHQGVPLQVPAEFGDIRHPARLRETPALLAAALLAAKERGPDTAAIIDALATLNGFSPPLDPDELVGAAKAFDIPPLTHSVRAGDTLASIAETYGFSDNGELGAYLLERRDLLAVGAVLAVPCLSLTPARSDTLGGLAAAYNLTADELSASVAGTPRIFVPGQFVTVPHVPALTLERFVSGLLRDGDLNTAAAGASRYLLHGLQLPEPPGSGDVPHTPTAPTTRALYDLIGQQFALPRPLPTDASFKVTNSGGQSWTQLYMGGYYTGTGDTLASVARRFAVTNPEAFEKALKQLNPGVTQPQPGTLLLFPGAVTHRPAKEEKASDAAKRFAAAGMSELFTAQLTTLNPGVDLKKPFKGTEELALPVTDSSTVLPGDTLESIALKFVPRDAVSTFSNKVKELNKNVDFTRPLVPGTVLALPVVTLRLPVKEIVTGYTPDERRQVDALHGATFAPSGLTVERLPAYREMPARHPFQHTLHWQCGQRPTHSRLTGAPPAGEPTLWRFPQSLAASLPATPGDAVRCRLMTDRPGPGPAGSAAAEVRHYVWATAVDIPIRRIADEDTPVPHRHLVLGADDTGREQLERLWSYLKSLGNATTEAFLLHAPNPTGANSRGLVSHLLDPGRTFLVETNLSTVSTSGRPPSGTADGQSYQHSADFRAVRDVVALLWKCSVVHGGGHYLNYATGSGGDLPSDIFDADGKATLTLLVIVDEKTPAPAPPPLRAAHNCAVVADNIDAGATNVFAQPVLHIATDQDTLKSVAAELNTKNGTRLDEGALAEANADVKNLLRPGARLSHDGRNHTVRGGDTFASVAAALGAADVRALGPGNAQVVLFRPGALLQLRAGDLRATSTAPAGTTGFRMARTEPRDAARQGPVADSAAAGAELDRLFHLLAHRVSGASQALRESAYGLPAGPAADATEGSDGVTSRTVVDGHERVWAYRKLLPVARYAKDPLGDRPATEQPGRSPLPCPWSDPYRGITAPCQEARLDFAFRDPYGNTATLAGQPELHWKVGYFDQLIGIDRWTGTTAHYAFLPPGHRTKTPTCALLVAFDTDTYVAGAGQPHAAAVDNAAAARTHYASVYHQLRQRDVRATLHSSLDMTAEGPAAPEPKPYPLDKTPLLGLVGTTYAFLRAAETLRAWKHRADAEDTLSTVAERYRLSAGELGEANADTPASDLFGEDGSLWVPEYHVFRHGDTPETTGLTAQQVGQGSLDVPLNPGTALLLTSQSRSAPLEAGDTLRAFCTRVHATAGAVAAANTDHPLTVGKRLRVGSTTLSTGAGDKLTTMVQRFAGQGVDTTAAQLGELHQNTRELFDRSLGGRLTVTDHLVQRGDTLGSLTRPGAPGRAAEDGGFALEKLWQDNQKVPDVFPVGSALWRENVEYVPEAEETLADVAAAHRISVATLTGLPANATAALTEDTELTVPDQVTLDPDTPPDAVRVLRDGDTLDGVASLWGQGITGAGLVLRNRHRPDLFSKNAADLRLGQVTVPVAVTDTFDTVYTAARKKGFTGDFQAFASAVAAADAQQRSLLATGALLICPALKVPAAAEAATAGMPSALPTGSLAQVAGLYGVPVDALVRADRSLRGLLRPGASVTHENVTVDIGPDDTLRTVVTRFTDQGVPLTLEKLAGHPDFTEADLLTTGAVLVPPPHDAAYALPFTSTPYQSDPLFNLTVGIELARDPHRLDPDAAEVPGVGSTTTLLPPRYSTESPGRRGGGGSARARSLEAFAAGFEEAFPGLKAAVSGPDEQTAGQLWVVDMRSDGLTFEIDDGSGNGAGDGEPNGSAAYFALPPLVTHPLHRDDVQVRPYRNGQLLTAQPRTFHDVDLDAWARTFTEAVDTFLAPVLATAVRAVDPDSLEKVTKHKKSIADRIARHVRPVHTGGTHDETAVGEAREVLRQAMLTELRNAYGIDVIVQLPVTVTSPYEDVRTAPRLVGAPTVTQDTSPGRPPAGEPEPDEGEGRTFSPAKISMVDGDTTLTFGLSTKKPADQRVVDVTMRYAFGEIEHRIRDVEGAAHHQHSQWLSLILPAADEQAATRSYTVPTDRVLTDGTAMGRLRIPVPLRARPVPPTMLGHTAAPCPPVPPVDPITARKQWEYAFSYAHPSAAQDTACVTVTFNAAEASRCLADAPTDRLFEALAQFTAVHQDLADDLAVLKELAPGQDSPTARAAVAVFAALVETVATAWPEAAAAHTGPDEEGIVLPYTVTPGEDGATLTLTLPQPPPDEIGWPELFVGSRQEGRRMTPEPPHDERARTYRYPLGAPAGAPAHEWVFPGLDITRLQSGTAAASVTRNANLGTDGRPVDERFVHRTAVVEFTGPRIPLLRHTEPLLIDGTGSCLPQAGSVGAALRRLFTGLFGTEEWSARIKFVARYGHRVQPAAERLTTFLPVFLLTDHTVSRGSLADFTGAVEKLLENWTDERRPSTAGAHYSFDLILFASHLSDPDRPVLELQGLHYPLEAGGGEERLSAGASGRVAAVSVPERPST
ncbi:LysM peptidoglycan-binding domain-containing protein [Streptomyces chrestomyceticus]|uniref:LysM peptidoglycan-binding domain-containing protein n=1 Tax=Streptomyces chrestomyceticus TaxID=68185 RepID=UPI0037AB7E6E